MLKKIVILIKSNFTLNKMVSQQSTTIPLDFTHLEPKFKTWDKRTCYMHPTEDNETIANQLLDDEHFSKFLFILQLSGQAKKMLDTNNYTLAVVPNQFMAKVCTTQLSKFDALCIIKKQLINNSIRPCDIGSDSLWIQNSNKEFVTLSQRYWNDAKILGSKQCSNGWIYIVDRLII